MSLSFSTTQRWVRTANLPDDAACTMCAWIRPSAVASATAVLGLESGTPIYLYLSFDGAGQLICAYNDGSASFNIGGVSNGTDYFIALTSTGTGAWATTGYIRASTANTLTSASIGGTRTGFTPTSLTLGATATQALPYSGRAWNTKVWDRALTAAEILVESYYSRVMFPASLNIHWPGKFATDTRDLSGNGRTPTVTGTLATADERGLFAPRRRIFLPAATSPITGSIALTLDPVGALTGSGALAGTVALTVTPTGALTGSGALAGSIDLTLTPTGALTAQASLEGSIPLSLNVVGALSGTGALAGDVAITLAPTGVLTGSGALTGAIPLALTPAGSLTGTGALAGSIALSLAPIGALSGTGALTGAIALALDLTGTLTSLGGGQMTGNVPLALLTSGILTGNGGLLGSLSFSFDLTGAMSGTGEMAGLADLALTPSGTLTDASAPPLPAPESFSGGFLFAYELEQTRRRRKRREQEELEEDAKQLQDQVDREIALLLHQAEAENERKAELDRLQALVKAHSHAQLQLSDRAKIAYVRALTQSNFSAMQALERELERMIFEEEAAAVMFLLNED